MRGPRSRAEWVGVRARPVIAVDSSGPGQRARNVQYSLPIALSCVACNLRVTHFVL